MAVIRKLGCNDKFGFNLLYQNWLVIIIIFVAERRVHQETHFLVDPVDCLVGQLISSHFNISRASLYPESKWQKQQFRKQSILCNTYKQTALHIDICEDYGE
jgi:hypothetical protein